LCFPEVVVTTTEGVRCIECGDELPAERVELGYPYCTKNICQAKHHRGLAITTVGMNKSADTVLVADADEVRRRGEDGQLARKDTGIGLDYRPLRAGDPRPAAQRPAAAATPPRPAARPRWTPQQEKLVRLYHGMGLSPRRIAERARENAPRLGITERLAVQILSSPPSRPGQS
jgi:hypothetical protein